MILVGAGSHSKQVQDILLLLNIKVIEIYDDFKTSARKINELTNIDNDIPLFCSIGDNNTRKNIINTYSEKNWINVIHPSSHVSPTAKLGKGNYIGFNSYIGPDAIIGDGNIINEYAAVLHEAKVGDFNHVSIRSTVGAKNIVGDIG